MFMGPTVSSFRSSSSWPLSAIPCLYLRPCSAHLYLLFIYICTSHFTFPFQTSQHKPLRKKINISKMISSFILSQELHVHVLIFLGGCGGDKNKISWVEEKFLVNKATFNLYSGVYRVKNDSLTNHSKLKFRFSKPQTPLINRMHLGIWQVWVWNPLPKSATYITISKIPSLLSRATYLIERG